MTIKGQSVEQVRKLHRIADKAEEVLLHIVSRLQLRAKRAREAAIADRYTAIRHLREEIVELGALEI